MDIAKVQLEVGFQATPLAFRSLMHEMELCQRYAEKSYSQGTYPGANIGGGLSGVIISGASSSQQGETIYFQVLKRKVPTMTFYDSAGNANACSYYNAGWQNNGTFTTLGPTDKGIGLQCTNTTTTVGVDYFADARL